MSLRPSSRLVLFCVALVAVGGWWLWQRDPAPIAGGKGGGVHGSVILADPRGDKIGAVRGKVAVDMAVPRFEVFLKDARSGAVVARTRTDLMGRYFFPTQKPGRYILAWDGAGWVPGQYARILSIIDHTQFPTPLRPVPFVGLRKGVQIGYLRGSVRMMGGGSPWFHHEDDGAKVPLMSVRDGAGRVLSKEAPTNVDGGFVVVNLPAVDVKVRARLEGMQAEAPVAGAALNGGVAPLALTFANRAPQLLQLVASVDGTTVHGGVASGAKVVVTAVARDPDGDALKYQFSLAKGDGDVYQDGSEAATWVVPNAQAKLPIHVTVGDGKGAYDRQTLFLAVGSPKQIFGGRVVELATGAAIEKVEVEVGGERTLTDAGGNFLLIVEPAKRYVLNIRKHGFATASKVYRAGSSGRTYRLTAARTFAVDPTQPIVIKDAGDPRDKQNSRDLSAVIRIPAKSLVDADGRAPSGPLTAALAALDIARDQMPGDWTAREADGSESNLISLGGAFVEFTDDAGRIYNMAPGTAAEVAVRAPASMLAWAPADSPLWSYDEKTGIWEQTGKATRVGSDYVGTVPHFSTVNTDLSKGDAACLKFFLERENLVGKIKLRITSTAFAQSFTFECNDSLNAAYRLPPNTDVKIDVLDEHDHLIPNAVVKDNLGAVVPSRIVNSGPASTPLWPEDPFTNCRLVSITLDVPTWLGYPGSPFLTFSGQYDFIAAADQVARADGYYEGVDPNGDRDTLGEWWTHNGFDGTTGLASDEVHASYLNHNDLGFGRDMHMRVHRVGGVVEYVAAYVTNYGGSDQNPVNADLAWGAGNPASSQATRDAFRALAVATVCMEWRAVEGQDPARKITKFFVYQGGLAGGVRQPSAVLDPYGQKYVPMLCQNCHGSQGLYAPTVAAAPTIDDLDLGSSFREFDLQAFKYPSPNREDADFQKDDFHGLNLAVKDSQPQSAITDLITNWYPNPAVHDPNLSYVPANWAAAPSLYLDVVAKSCRTCHVSFPDDTYGISWHRYSQLKNYHPLLSDFVQCGPGRRMPHAYWTYHNFWLNTGPHGPTELGTHEDLPDWPAITCP